MMKKPGKKKAAAAADEVARRFVVEVLVGLVAHNGSAVQGVVLLVLVRAEVVVILDDFVDVFTDRRGRCP
jgi:hypothetical protein